MAKIKNKKRISADQIHKKREAMNSKKTMNPFEVHINKEKMRILGKKQKNDRGLPGVSRAKAIQKRKHTLLQEYKLQNKSNKFSDKRIGEKNRTMTEDDKVMARFTAVRVKAQNKKNIFNLADDEILTHRGQTLSEVEKFDDPRSDDEESLDEDKTGKLNSSFVEDAHFGGGLFKNTGQEGAKTHRQLIDQLIEESKKRKAEKQKIKEATLELTEKLDTEWKDLLPLVNKSKKTEEDAVHQPQVDDYDKVMRELRFEARGTVSDRLKTVDEIAKEEKDKLEQLEKERLNRMKGFIEEKADKPKHRSADDLDDDFVYDSDPEYMLSYNNKGESSIPVNAEMNGKVLNEEGNKDEAEREENDIDDEELETDSEDNLSDLKEDSSESELEDTSENQEPVEDKPKSKNTTYVKTGETNVDNKPVKLKENDKNESIEKESIKDQENIKADLLERKTVMEQARKELPYTFSLPETYESLQKVLENQSSNHQSIILERMIKCNHPSLSELNKDGLGLLFAYFLQYLNDLFSGPLDEKSLKNNFEIFNAIVPQIYELAQLNQLNAHNSMLEVIKEKHEEFKKKFKEYPGLETLVFLKLVSLLFSTSDFRHQIVTPCFVFVEQMLTKCKVRSKRDICYGLFLSTIVLEYTTLSKRYLPAVINFLSGLLHMAIPKTSVKLIKVLTPFKSISSLLVLINDHSEENVLCNMNVTDLLDIELTEDCKCRIIYMCLKLLEEFYLNFKILPSNVEIFTPVVKYLKLIPFIKYPKKVQKEYKILMKKLNDLTTERKLEFIVMESTKPKALRLYEPKIIEIYDGKRHKVQSKEKADRDKMLHKLKKETKGALREIRRDKSFLGRVKINQKIQSDRERREKVKRIYAEASMQQSELNTLDRKKKKK